MDFEKILKIAIGLALFMFVAAPLGALGLHIAGAMNMASFYSNFGKSNFDSRQRRSIASGLSYAQAEEFKSKLRSITAYQGEVDRAAKVLDVIVVEFDSSSGKDAASDGFQNIELDMTSSEDTGVVIVSRSPIRWKILPHQKQRRGLVGLESIGPVDIESAPEGILSGYRVKAFGSAQVTAPEHYIEQNEPHYFCKAINTWQGLYGVTDANVSLQVAVNPTRITGSPYGTQHNGETIDNLPDYADFCTFPKITAKRRRRR